MNDTREIYDTTPSPFGVTVKGPPWPPPKTFRVPHEPYHARRDAILAMLVTASYEATAQLVSDIYWITVQHASAVLRQMVEDRDLVVVTPPGTAGRPIRYRVHESVLAQVRGDEGYKGVLEATHRRIMERLDNAWFAHLSALEEDNDASLLD